MKWFCLSNLVLLHFFLIFLFPFLSGLRVYGKDFRQIQKNKVSKESTANKQVSLFNILVHLKATVGFKFIEYNSPFHE